MRGTAIAGRVRQRAIMRAPSERIKKSGRNWKIGWRTFEFKMRIRCFALFSVCARATLSSTSLSLPFHAPLGRDTTRLKKRSGPSSLFPICPPSGTFKLLSTLCTSTPAPTFSAIASMAAPSPPATLPLDNDALLQELASTIQAGIRSAADTLLHSYTQATPTLSPTCLHHLLKNLFSTLQPSMQRELVLQLDLLRSTVLALPPDADELRIAEELAHAREARNRNEEGAVDREIAETRAGLREAGVKIRYLREAGGEIRARERLLEGLTRAGDADGVRVLQDVQVEAGEAEEEYKECVRVLSMSGAADAIGGGGMANRGRADLADDEHAPLCSFVPSPVGILDLEVDERQLREWAALRERLLA